MSGCHFARKMHNESNYSTLIRLHETAQRKPLRSKEAADLPPALLLLLLLLWLLLRLHRRCEYTFPSQLWSTGRGEKGAE